MQSHKHSMPFLDEDGRPDVDFGRLTPTNHSGKILKRGIWQGVLLGLCEGDLPCFNRWKVIGPENPVCLKTIEIKRYDRISDYPGYSVDLPNGEKQRIDPIEHFQSSSRRQSGNLTFIWEDGSTFSWNYDQKDGELRQVLIYELMVHSGLHCPIGMSMGKYQEYLGLFDMFNRGVIDMARHILRHCEL